MDELNLTRLVKSVPLVTDVEVLKIRTMKRKHFNQVELMENFETLPGWMKVVGRVEGYLLLINEDTGTFRKVSENVWVEYLFSKNDRNYPHATKLTIFREILNEMRKEVPQIFLD